MYRMIFAVALLIGAQTLASANGGGNSKGTGGLLIVNKDATQTLLVAVDPTPSLIAATTAAQFIQRGGKIVNVGGGVTFGRLKVGRHVLSFVFVPTGTVNVLASSFVKQDVKVVAGHTETVNLTKP